MNESLFLVNKYQVLSELCDRMTQNRIKRRPESCRQILKNKHLWTLSQNEFNVRKEMKEFCDTCDENYKNYYIFRVMIK